MGFGRDLGAALTMGLSPTTKLKEAEKDFEKRSYRHQRLVAAFNDSCQKAYECIQRLDGEFESARDALLSSGAMTVDTEGVINYGWYRPVEEACTGINGIDRSQALLSSLPAFGVAVGAPVLTWTLVGALGTAATGTAIHTLSGAAAGAATAAWIGRAATLGLAGMTAGRFALGPIALLSMPVQVAIGAKVAGHRERKGIRQLQDSIKVMDRRDSIMSDLKVKLEDNSRQANTTAANLSRHTGQLEMVEVGGEAANQAAARLDSDMRRAVEILHEFAGTVPVIQEELGGPIAPEGTSRSSPFS